MAIPLQCLHYTLPGNEFFSFRCSPVNTPQLNPQLPSSANCLQDNSSARTTQRKQPLCCWEGLFTDSLPSNKRPVVVYVGFRGYMFSESLRSSGSIGHNIIWFHISSAANTASLNNLQTIHSNVLVILGAITYLNLCSSGAHGLDS
jgi:hypothetical protein